MRFLDLQDMIQWLHANMDAAPVQIAVSSDDDMEEITVIVFLANGHRLSTGLCQHPDDCDFHTLASQTLTDAVVAWGLRRMRLPRGEIQRHEG